MEDHFLDLASPSKTEEKTIARINTSAVMGRRMRPTAAQTVASSAKLPRILRVTLTVVAASSFAPSPKAAMADTGVFVWMSDAHYDPFYSTPNAQIHVKGAPCNHSSASPKFSAYGCGSSAALVDSAVSNSARAVAELGYTLPDFVLYTGDSTRHNTDGLPVSVESIVEEAVNFTNSLFQSYFPDVPVVRLPAPDLGNNDLPGDYALNVTSTDPCLPDETGRPPVATNAFLQQMAELNAASFATPMESAVFACGGYVHRRVLNGLSVISLNTIVWSLNLDPPLRPSTEDAFGQHVWLKLQLQDAREYGYKVYLTGHIAPILQSYVGSVGQPLWQPFHLQQYLATVEEYQDVIAAQLFAHVHSNELRAVSQLSPDAPPMLVQGSIAPCYTTNPFFTLVQFDRNETLRPVDLVTYQVDLSVHTQSIEANPDPGGIWMRLFDNLTTHLNLTALTNRDTQLLSERLVQDDNTFEAYFDKWYKGTPQNCSTPNCRRKEACLLPCGFDNASWQGCVNNDPGGGCNLGLPLSTSRVAGRGWTTLALALPVTYGVCAAALDAVF